ncbi:MAG: histidine phosphatase family protein [Candidatus Dormibacteraceae bacterium]
MRSPGAAGTLELWLVRHGATEWSESGRHTGLTDLPLLSLGERQAQALSRPLGAVDFTAIFSSDRQRAMRTAQLAGFPAALPSPLLREFDYGAYEGLTSDEIHGRDPDWEVFTSGGPGGESPGQVMDRARLFLEQVPTEGRLLVFSHGHFLRALAGVWTGLGAPLATRLTLDPASICVLESALHGPCLQRWNLLPTG